MSGIDESRPHPARMYDYILGGTDNFPADREAARRALDAVPDVAVVARENRAFLGRAVRFLAGPCGIRQFVDVGTGIPTRGNTHEVAQALAPDARVAYVDNDPLVIAHARRLLAANDRTATVQADLRDPAAVLGAPAVRDLIDFTRPVALLFVAVLHFVPDEDHPYDLLARYREALPPGSHLVISHAEDNPANAPAQAAYARTGTRAAWRTRPAVEHLFTGWDLYDPGVVYLHQWRPAGTEHPCELGLCGVARKTPGAGPAGGIEHIV